MTGAPGVQWTGVGGVSSEIRAGAREGFEAPDHARQEFGEQYAHARESVPCIGLGMDFGSSTPARAKDWTPLAGPVANRGVGRGIGQTRLAFTLC